MKQKYLAALSIILILALLAACAARTPNTQPEASVDVRADPIIGTVVEPTTSPAPEVSAPLNPLAGIPHGSIAMEHIVHMNDNLYGRTPFSYRELETALWIAAELSAMGHPEENIEVQGFSWEQTYQWAWDSWEFIEHPQGRDFFRDFPVREGRLSQNVILSVPGRSEQVIVVAAHYDGFQYAGAADNASGVALLLESAQRMLHKDNYYTIVYVFFGAEEVGLLGSYFYVESLSEAELENILLVVNADVLFEGPYLIYATGYDREEEPGEDAISRAVDSIAYELSVLDGIEFVAFPQGVFWYSDHSPFFEVGHTVVVFAGLTEVRDSLWDPQLIHSPRDCIHYINENWPGMAERSMRAYSVFLERILLSMF